MELRRGQENLLNDEPCYPAILTFLVQKGIENRLDGLEESKELEARVCEEVTAQDQPE